MQVQWATLCSLDKIVGGTVRNHGDIIGKETQRHLQGGFVEMDLPGYVAADLELFV